MANPRFVISRVQGAPVTDVEIVADLCRVAELLGTGQVSQPLYKKHGIFDTRTISRRFGTWNKAIIAAGLKISNEINISDERLFKNILVLWEHYGRQPRRAELSRSPSKISQGAYRRRFRTWMEALQLFTDWANVEEEQIDLDPNTLSTSTSRTKGRDPSLRLRFKVMMRDRFTCKACGASPAIQVGVELHVDHITPWSKGGDTSLDNLQTLCSQCNLGKGNMSQIAG